MKNMITRIIIVSLFAAADLLGQGRSSLLTSAQHASQDHRYAEALQDYQAAVDQGERSASVFYNMACLFAIQGKPTEAMTTLKRAVDYGFADDQLMKTDTDLQSLHNEPAWPGLLDEIRRTKSFWNLKEFNIPFAQKLSEEERIAGLSLFWSEAKYNFVNFNLGPELNWDSCYIAALPKVRSAAATADYYRVLMNFAALLHDGHTGVTPPQELGDEFYARIPVRTELVEGKVLVMSVSDDTLRRAGIVPGCELLALDNEPVHAYAMRVVAPLVTASTSQDSVARIFTYNLLTGKAGSQITLKLADAAGKEFNATATRRRISGTPIPLFQWTMLPNGIAKIEINSFNDTMTAFQFEAAFDSLRHARGWIIDVRANGGGNSNTALRILACMTKDGVPSTLWRTREYHPSLRAWNTESIHWYEGSPNLRPSNTRLRYDGPVIVLAGARTYSAAEDFCSSFRMMKRGLIVGSPTGGSTGQPLFFRLPGGGSARICTKYDWFPDGTAFIGKGIQPDVLVEPTIADVRNQRDPVVSRAVELALQQGKK